MSGNTGLSFFDCNCAIGSYRTRVFRFARTAAELLEEMDFCNVSQALVYHTAMRFDLPTVGNELIVKEIEGHSRLLPVWTILPAHTQEQPDLAKLLKEMQTRGVRVLRLFPDDHRYSLDDISLGDQMAVYADRRIPLLIRASLDKIAGLLRSFPSLVVITGSQGSNPLDRYAWPLIEKFPNLIFETSSYLVDGAIEEFCKRYSASRLIFGSGFPDNASGAAMLALAQAEISEAERQAIALENLCRLLAEVSLG